MPDGSVSGSVIQRAFVGATTPATLFAASVPVSELGGYFFHNDDFKNLVAEVLALPPNVLLDESDYRNLSKQLINLFTPADESKPEMFWSEWNRRAQLIAEEMQSEKSIIETFAEHSIALMIAKERDASYPLLISPFIAEQLSGRFDLSDETAFSTGAACLNAAIQRTRRTVEFTNDVLRYDLPYGQSPSAKSDSLLKLLETGKKMCLAPMAAGAALGVTQLTQTQYIAAVLSVGTGSLMTLILLGSVSVGSILVSRVAQGRSRSRRA